MDRILCREEKHELITLLDLPPQCWGNLPMMKSYYKKMCLVHHPDKGGDLLKMMRMNELWQKLQNNILELRTESSSSYFSQEDEHPVYGTPQFKDWWYSGGADSFTESPPKRPQRRRKQDLHCDETLGDSSDEDDIFGRRESPHPSTSQTDNFPFHSSGSSSSQCNGETPFSSAGFQQTSTPHPEKEQGKRSRSPEGSSSGFASSSQGSYSSTPPKAKKPKADNNPTDFPNCLFEYLSHAIYSNKTMNSFCLYTTAEKGPLLYNKIEKFKPDFKSLHAYQEAHIIFILTLGKHRVSAVKNFCSGFCTVSFLICKAVNKPVECYDALCKEPFSLIEENKPGLFQHEFTDKEEQTCSWNLVAKFAEDNNLDDPLMIMAHYLDFNEEYPCKKCEKKQFKVHYNFHKLHQINAGLFFLSKQQKSICQQAADVVLAKRRLKLLEATRSELLAEKIKVQIEKLRELTQIPMLQYMAGVAWYSCLFERTDEVVKRILQLVTENVPKKRNILFRGPVNSGKTSFAAALMDLIDGKALNINCPPDKLPFELGCAIDQFAVVFEDVKGQISMNKNLQPGQGMSNLDNMRDFLDGAVKVNLEKKHMNKRSQIFPPCIVTCNEYVLPQTLFIRFAYCLNFCPKDNLKKSLDKNSDLSRYRILQSGLTIVMLLIWYAPVSEFVPELQEDIRYWKQILEQEVGYEKFSSMIENVEAGDDPLLGILVEEDDKMEEENADSGNFTQ
ncbi:large tumor antigen [Castor fiber polyomavirus 1]